MSETNASDTAALEELAVNTIRVLSFECVQRANSGHPGLPMGCADRAYTLFTDSLKFDPKAPEWPDRDRFVLSAGLAPCSSTPCCTSAATTCRWKS